MKKMRGKPDLAGIATPLKDPTAFLEGGAGDVADNIHRDVLKPDTPKADTPPVPTVQKLFRMRWDIAKALKDAANSESTPGHRVTETEIVERLLKQHFGIE